MTANVSASTPSTSNLRLVGVYRVLSRGYFHLPILFVFLYGRLSLVAVECVLAGYGLLVALAPYVTARPTSRMSLRQVIVAGEAIKVGGLTLLALGPHLGSILAGQVLSALGFSLTAGTDSAYLGTLCSGADYRRRESTTQSWMFAGSLVAGVIGATLFAQDRALPFVASALAAGAAAVILLIVGVRTSGRWLAESPSGQGDPGSRRRAASRGPQAEPSRATPPHVRPGAEGPAPPALDGASLLWSRYYSLARGFVLAAYVGFLPYLLYVQLRLGLAWFGVVLGVFTLTGFVVARVCATLGRDRSRIMLAATSLIAIVAGFAILGAPSDLPAVLVAIVLLGVGSGTVRPMAMGSLEPVLRTMTPAQRRAITTSMERRQALCSATILAAGGLAVSRYGIRSWFLTLSVGCLAAAGLLVVAYRVGSRGRAGQDVRTQPAPAGGP